MLGRAAHFVLWDNVLALFNTLVRLLQRFRLEWGLAHQQGVHNAAYKNFTFLLKEKISQLVERVLMEHIVHICSLEPNLFFISTCSIKIICRK